MSVREFYESMKEILKVSVVIVKEGEILWEGYIDENRIYEHLMNYKIETIYLADIGLGIKI